MLEENSSKVLSQDLDVSMWGRVLTMLPGELPLGTSGGLSLQVEGRPL